MAKFKPATERTGRAYLSAHSTLNTVLHLPNLLFIGVIRLYQITLSPILPRSCRFTPSCSVYGYQAFQKYNVLKACYLTAWRILRCNPFNRGGYDPLP